jgi:hypothetical protein
LIAPGSTTNAQAFWQAKNPVSAAGLALTVTQSAARINCRAGSQAESHFT